MAKWVVTLPAWGERCVDVCTRWVIPSIRFAIGLLKGDHEFRFIVHTDQPDAFRSALDGLPLDLRQVPRGAHNFMSFIAAHNEVIHQAPVGWRMVLLNADIVVSREFFAFADATICAGYKAIGSVGNRTLPKGEVPIGADAVSLNRWGWENRHPIVVESLWGSGHTRLPTVLVFVSGENVLQRCFHLAPVVAVKDARAMNFGGTIDDGLLGRYGPSEIYVVANHEWAMIEISPHGKQFGLGKVIDVQEVVALGSRSFNMQHLWNAKHRLPIIGDPSKVDDRDMSAILSGLQGVQRIRQQRSQMHQWAF